MLKVHLYDKVLCPVVTEKSTTLSQYNQVAFKVDVNSSSIEIKNAIEKLFKVNVIKVNIINRKPKLKMRQGRKSIKSGYKKAIVTLKKGQSIDLTTGI